MEKRRLLNVRIMFVSLVGLICGILFFYLVLSSACLGKFNYYIIPLALIIAFNIVCLILKLFKTQNSMVRTINKYFSASVCFAVMLVLGVSNMALRLVPMMQLRDYVSVVPVQCVVSDITVKDNYLRAELKNVTVAGDKISEHINMLCYYDGDLQDVSISVGDKLSFSSVVRLTPLFDKSSNLMDYLYGSAYNVKLNFDNIQVTNGKADVRTAIGNHIYNTLNKSLSEDNASIAYSMLLGSKEHMSSDISQMFSYAGVAHILAVSGLHVGLIVALVVWCLRKCKLNKWWILGVTSVMLLVYCWLCRFSPSVSRASIMSVVLLLASASGKEYDPLSALSLAGIIILMINPLNFMSIGFQLSFLCVLSIITLSNSITRMLSKIKLPRAIAQTLAMSVCINLVILPICANSFDKVSLIGVLANVLVLPLFSITFPILFVCTFISCILPWLSFILYVPNMLLHVIKVIANFFAGIPFATFRFYNISYIVLIVAILLILTIKYLMLSGALKAVICGCMAIIIAVTFAINMTSANYNGNIVLSYQYSSNNAVICVSSKNYLLGIGNNYWSTTLKSLKIRSIDSIIAYDFASNKINYLNELCSDYNVSSVYLPTGVNADIVSKIKADKVVVVDQMNIGNLQGKFVYDVRGSCIAYYIQGEHSVMFANASNTRSQTLSALYSVDYVDYLIVNELNVDTQSLDNVNKVIGYNSAQTNANLVDLYRIDKYLLKVA